ncbi:MAG TPA: hypothetical protein PKV72_01500 [Candidatus Peribacteria bacterium]|nr:hypothetical protein [Candidatus Peribacteria bacterium]
MSERDKATEDLLQIVKIMGANMPSEIAARVLALRDTDRAAFVEALEIVYAKHHPRPKPRV